jgi:hypothetical protein
MNEYCFWNFVVLLVTSHAEGYENVARLAGDEPDARQLYSAAVAV